MFNENKIWHSVKARRDFHRKQRNSQARKRRRLQNEVCEKRFFESRPFFRKSKFQTIRHDQYRYERLVKWYGEGEKAKALYHKEVHPKSNKFWWEDQFKHEKYITAKGRAYFRDKREAEERELRDNFKVFLDTVPQEQHKRLKDWLDDCDIHGEYKGLFEDEDGIDEDAFLFEEDAYSNVDWPEVLPVPIINTLFFLLKSWPKNTIPILTRAKENVEVDEVQMLEDTVINEETEEQNFKSDESDSDCEFDAGF